MSFVIYEVESTRLIRKNSWSPAHKSERAAKSARTRYLKAHPEVEPESLAIAEYSVFHNSIERMVERKNLMSGEFYMERVNTPISCSPSSETYWSM